jgi:hypothetical protein
MRLLYGYYPTQYHATQLAFQVLNALLVYGIATYLFRSHLLGLATAFAYAAAPGHAMATFWNATFTMTGTACFYFVGLLIWIRGAGRWRTPLTVTCFVTALLASEHAVSFPLALTITAWLGYRQPWRRIVREQAIYYAISALYVTVKLVYLSLLLTGVIKSTAMVAINFGYHMQLDPVLFLENLGSYVGMSFSVLYVLAVEKSWNLLIGMLFTAVAVAATILVARDRWTTLPVRTATIGLDLFIVALAPVVFLRGHLLSYYVGIAGLGASLAVVGFTAGMLPFAKPLGAPLAIATLMLVHATSTATAVRHRPEFAVFDAFSETAQDWLFTLRWKTQHMMLKEVVVPHTPVTDYVLGSNEAHKVLLCAPYDVRFADSPRVGPATPGSLRIDRPLPVPPHLATRRNRWEWLRSACASAGK